MKQHKLTAIHEAVLVNNHEALKLMIDKLQANPLPDINDKNRKELLYKKYEDFFELNKIVEYQNAEKAFNEFI